MDEIFGILMEQIVLFLFYMIVGVLLVKTHILAENTLETLSRALDLLDLRNPHDANFNQGVSGAVIAGVGACSGVLRVHVPDQ